MFLLAGHDIITCHESRVTDRDSSCHQHWGQWGRRHSLMRPDTDQRVLTRGLHSPQSQRTPGQVIWVTSSKYQQKESPSRERDVSRTFYHFHFPIFCRPSHLSSVAAVASLYRRLQCISGDKSIVNKYRSRTLTAH